MILGIVVTVVGTIGLLVAEWRDLPTARWGFKPLASAGFLLAALRAPEWVTPTGAAWLLLAGLALSALGDVLLVPRSKMAFIGGIGAFALAHVTYGAWFLGHGAATWLLAPVALAFLVIGHRVWRWLDPHVSGAMRVPVRVYVALVSLMAACAIAYGAGVSALALLPAIGGVLFYLSDLAVARHRFVAPGFVNRAWGLPTYYLAQLLIAYAVHG